MLLPHQVLRTEDDHDDNDGVCYNNISYHAMDDFSIHENLVLFLAIYSTVKYGRDTTPPYCFLINSPILSNKRSFLLSSSCL
jgi:hypothetical protein